MGKKGSWFSAIKRVFIPNSKQKLDKVSDKKSNNKEKKKARGILTHGESKSFIPLFREPSSIEKILGEADQHKLLIRPSTPFEQPPSVPLRAPSPRVTSPRAPSPRAASPRVPSPRVGVARQQREISYYRPEPTQRNRHLSATKIQAAYRGYMARRSFRALRGLVRLQGVVRGQSVKKQTINAMKHMQLLVRIQTQIQSRRIQMLENQALQRQPYNNNDKQIGTTLGKWNFTNSEAGENENWDDTLLTKEEVEARMQRKVEAIIRRERAMAYAYSNQLWRGNPKSPQMPLMDIRSGGFPWWWNWLERQLPSESQPSKNTHPTPPRPTPDHRPSPRHQTPTPTHKQQTSGLGTSFGLDNLDSVTPRSTKSTVTPRTRPMYTPSSRTPPTNTPGTKRFPLRDDDSLTSCPPFSVPNYMTPTASAKAKARANGSDGVKERFPGTPGSVESSKRRFSFPLTPNLGSFKWNKASSSKDTTSQKALDKPQSLHSMGDLSVDSTVSMPAAVGRRPFNRFV